MLLRLRLTTFGGPGMTVDEARRILASGAGTPEELAEANRVYYGQYYSQQPSVQAAAQQADQGQPVPERPDPSWQPYHLLTEDELRRYGFAPGQRIRWDPMLWIYGGVLNFLEEESYTPPAGGWREIPWSETIFPGGMPPPGSGAGALELWRTGQQAIPQPGTQQAVQQAVQKTRTAASSQPASYRPTVVLRNLSRPGAADFYLGERFRLEITGGPPNAPVIDTATHDGQTSTTRHGTTDVSGNWSIEGAMAEEHIGSWAEAWKVGDWPASPAVLAFKVARRPEQAGGQGRAPGAAGGGGSQGATPSGGPAPGPGAADNQAQTELADWLEGIKEAASRLPWYAWAGIAVGLLLLRRR